MSLGRKIVLVICLIVFVGSAGVLIDYFLNGMREQNALEGLKDLQTGREDLVTDKGTVIGKYADLYLTNSDIIGWIKIEDTKVDYPVMQTPADPNYYLKHDFEKHYTDYGCPFMQADCDELCPSDNLIIYGHNMKDGSMFADLAKYRSKDFWQTHKTVWFDTELGSSAYEIFAVIHTTVQADTTDAFPFYRFVDAATPEEFADYVSACKARALYDTGISAEYGDKLLTLSTCDNLTDDGRWLIIAKQTETE